MKININPKKELFKWGPIDGRPIYVDPFTRAFIKYKNRFKKYSWPDVIHYFENDRIVVVLDDADLRDRGEKLFKDEVLNEKKLKANYARWVEATRKIEIFEKIVNAGLSNYSDKELLKLFSNFDKAHHNFWVEGFLPELSNWGGEKILKEEVAKNYADNYIEILEKLGAPEELSFFQKEEMEFLKLKLIRNEKEFEKRLRKHQEKYYWLKNSYCFTEVLSEDYFKKELEGVDNKKSRQKILDIENHKEVVTAGKNKMIKKYKINKEIVNIAEKLVFCIVWQDYRKKFIFIANHINTKFAEEVSKRKNIPFKEVCYYCPEEIIELMKTGKEISAKERYKGFLAYYDEKKNILWYLIGKRSKVLIKPFLEIKINKKLKEFKGLVVSRGKNNVIRGVSRILLTPRNLEKMKEGDVLISPMTSPDFIVAMRKASAIITDEGGMTCHAAIVSRELKIPCLVSTKIATKVLKDGDLVEVNANHGMVRIIKSNKV